jgi:hypothetical protein
MRVLPLLALLAGCYDSATTTITLDVKAGTAHVVQQLHNAWPDGVGCEADASVETCVAGIRKAVDDARAELVTNGATVRSAGVVLADGELDLLYAYDAAVGSKAVTEQGLALVYLEDRSAGQVEKGRPGKKRVALFTLPLADGTTATTVDGRYRLLSTLVGDAPLSAHVFRGRHATITSEWTYVQEQGGKGSPGAWLRERPGLEDAIRASGLVVEPPV